MSTSLSDYRAFVDAKLSDPSSNLPDLIARMEELNELVSVPGLLTASEGLASEAGEFGEIVKKMIFQGKPFNEDNRFHLKRELGDIMFYVACAALALDYTLQDIIDENVNKLSARFKDGFTVEESEIREDGDL